MLKWFPQLSTPEKRTDSFWQLMVTRSLQGIGFGGEWAVGAALISETIKREVRGWVVDALQAGWAVGYGLAVLLSTLMFDYLPPAVAWRVLFGLGIFPAVLVLWIRRKIQEAPFMQRPARSRRAK